MLHLVKGLWNIYSYLCGFVMNLFSDTLLPLWVMTEHQQWTWRSKIYTICCLGGFNLLFLTDSEFADDIKQAILQQGWVLTKIGDNAELSYLSTTGILSGPVVFLKSRFLKNVKTPHAGIGITKFLWEEGKLAQGWPLSSNMELLLWWVYPWDIYNSGHWQFASIKNFVLILSPFP